MYSLGAKLLVVCAGPRQPRLQSGNNFCAVDTYLYFCESAGDKPWYLHREKLPLRCISNLPLGVTNEGREAISGLSTSLVVLTGQGIAIVDSLVETVPDYTDEQSERATVL